MVSGLQLRVADIQHVADFVVKVRVKRADEASTRFPELLCIIGIEITLPAKPRRIVVRVLLAPAIVSLVVFEIVWNPKLA